MILETLSFSLFKKANIIIPISPDKRAAAINYALGEQFVFPVWQHGKNPMTPRGFNDASKDCLIVDEWWKRWPYANIGLPTGSIHGFWVLDIDGEAGEETLRFLELLHGTLPKTVEVRTGGGGRHLYFRYPQKGWIGSKTGVFGKGLDVRGNGGYVVAPPSVHQSGRIYSFSSEPSMQMAFAPDWLIAMVQSPATLKDFPSTESWHQLAKGVEEGSRNDTLMRIAGKLLRQENNDSKFVLEICLAWNESRCKPPLPEKEVFSVVNSIAKRELQRRGGSV